MKKSLFQTLDEMNQGDVKNKTKNVGVFNHVIGGNMNKNNANIKMGVSREVFQKITMTKELIPILVVVNKKEFDELI